MNKNCGELFIHFYSAHWIDWHCKMVIHRTINNSLVVLFPTAAVQAITIDFVNLS
jgi:hypothetical protein